MNARFIALLVLVGAASAVAFEDANCDVPGFFESYCQHGGVCRDNSLTYADPAACLCPTPSIGTACSYIVRECRDSPCINGGSCRNQPSGGNCATNNNYDCFRCSCPPGWGYPLGWPWVNNNKGGICDTPRPVIGCDAFPCQNGGTCVDSPSSVSRYTCTCTGTGWVGQNCTFNCTLGGVCQNGGTCDRGSCLCTSQYQGYDCSSPRFCTTSPCMNGATCSNAGSGSCACTSGWSGKYCSVPSFCSSNPCSAGGTCRDDLSDPAGGQGACQCPPGYNSGWIGGFIDYGIKNCSTMNFCGASPCQNAATCVQNIGDNDGTCSCREGFAGKYCEVNLANLKACYNKVNGKQCFDHGSCGCTDQASCKTNDWNVRCECEDQTSSNTGLGYADCRCNSTYVPRCPTATSAAGDYPCQNGGTCREHAAGWGCDCRTGFYGSRCESYHNPCGSSPCQNGGQCSIITETGGLANQLKDTYWTYRCQCKYPYYGRECQNKIEDPANVCTNTVPAPVCQNGGSCVPRPYNFNYYPASALGGGGFFTDFHFGGRFIVRGQSGLGLTVRKELPPWMCKCVAGYTGEQCEFSGGYNPQIFTCGVNWPPITTTAGAFTCANGGTCVNAGDGPKCACRCGFSGEYCEVIANGLDSAVAETYMDNYGVKMDFCKTNICQNGGSCVTTADWQDAACLCAPGFFGYYCQYQGLASGANVLPSAIVVAAAAVVAAALRM